MSDRVFFQSIAGAPPTVSAIVCDRGGVIKFELRMTPEEAQSMASECHKAAANALDLADEEIDPALIIDDLATRFCAIKHRLLEVSQKLFPKDAVVMFELTTGKNRFGLVVARPDELSPHLVPVLTEYHQSTVWLPLSKVQRVPETLAPAWILKILANNNTASCSIEKH